MDWRDVRLNLDVPPGWSRLEDVEPLSFQAASGVTLRLRPLSPPASLAEDGSPEPLLGWALEQARIHLGAPRSTRVSPCRFGLCAALSFENEHPLRLWVLASSTHVLLVSLDGPPQSEDLARAADCVASIRLVSAAQFLN